MISEKSNIVIERSDSFEESSLILKPSAHLMKILRSGIYTDKILAVLREYSANAYDAHVEVGKKDVPIKIQLPSVLDPTLIIRDFGKGLSDYEVRNIFGAYGESTKDNTNEQIGMMGIGSKAFAAYCQSVMVTSIYNGRKSVYTMYIDESEIGKIARLSDDPTDEESGIEIAIPVQKSDITFFVKKAQFLFQFWTPHPHITGNSSYKRVEHEYHYEGAGYKFPKLISDPLVVMGGIPYNINYRSLNIHNPSLEKILNADVVLYANIGEVAIASSREELEYNDKTKQWLIKKLGEISKEIQSNFDKTTANVKTEYDAHKLYYDYFGATGQIHSFLTSLIPQKSVPFNGKSIQSTIIRSPFNFIRFERYERGHSGVYCLGTDEYQKTSGIDLIIDKTAGHEVLFYWVDNNPEYSLHKLKYLVRHYLTDNNLKTKPIHVFRINDESEFKKWTTEFGFPDGHFANILEYIQLPPKPPKVPKVKAPKVPKQTLQKTPVSICAPNEKALGKQEIDIENSSGYYLQVRYRSLKFFRDNTFLDFPSHRIPEMRLVLDYFGDQNSIAILEQQDVKIAKKCPNKWKPLEPIIIDYLERILNEPIQFTQDDVVKHMCGYKANLYRIFSRAISNGTIKDQSILDIFNIPTVIGKTPCIIRLCDQLGMTDKRYAREKLIAKVSEDKSNQIVSFLRGFPMLDNIIRKYIFASELGEKELIFYVQMKLAEEKSKIQEIALDPTLSIA